MVLVNAQRDTDRPEAHLAALAQSDRAVQFGREHLLHITGGKTYELGEAE